MTAPSRPTLRAKYDRRRHAVVDAAAHAFAQRGYHATSIDDLVAATGLQRGGLYHYIGAKQELLLLIHDELMSPLLEQAEQVVAAASGPEQALRDLLRVWVEHVAAHRDHMTVFTEERRLLESDPAWESVREARERFRDLLAGLLADGGRSGAFRISDPDMALYSILGIVNYMSVWLDPGGRLTPAEIADHCAALLLDGLAPR
jgi:AcrR family transcriptional regulator